MYEMMEANDIQLFKKEFPEYYWQLVSNAILTGKQVAELIIYLPYLSELEEIRELAANNTDIDLETKLFWIANSIDEDLPHQPDNSGYNHLKIFRFEILDCDIDILTEKIKKVPEEKAFHYSLYLHIKNKSKNKKAAISVGITVGYEDSTYEEMMNTYNERLKKYNIKDEPYTTLKYDLER
jgi:hypothetical protein